MRCDLPFENEENTMAKMRRECCTRPWLSGSLLTTLVAAYAGIIHARYGPLLPIGH